jgi:hypothetical protein
MHVSNLDRLAEVNARLLRARQEYRSALDAHNAGRANASKPADSTSQRVRLAAQEFERALDEFIKFDMTSCKTQGPGT